MESALCLNYVPMPSLQAHRLPSMVSTTRPHFTFSHSSRMLSNASTIHLKRHAFSPIIKHKAPSVRASGDDSPKPPEVLKTFLDNINSKLASTTFILPSPRPPVHDVNILKMEAMRLWKSAEEAKKVLQEALQNCKNDAELEYNLSLALAEIYIFQGKYEKANGCLPSFLSEYAPPSDPRFPLYQAIIFTMLDMKDEARKSWEQYEERVEQSPGMNLPGSSPTTEQ